MNIYKDTKKIILEIICENFKDLKKENINKITCEQPKNYSFGDVSTNAVMMISKTLNLDKKQLAKILIHEMLKNKIFEKIDFVEPGFLNIFFSNAFWMNFLKNIYFFRREFGFNNLGNNKKINIEFVSANPTGPLHVGHLRGAIFGDVLSKLLSKTGFKVTKEYYVNDLGVQVDNLALSINHHIENAINNLNRPLSENMYKGDYLKKIADNFLKTKPFNHKEFLKLKDYSVASNLDLIKEDLKNIGVTFDNYIYEKNIHESGRVTKVINILKKNNDIYKGVLKKPIGKNEQEWKSTEQLLFKSSKYGDKSDRVIKKNNGDWTYFASDIAYHYDKATRGYDEIINVWGADHGGYIERVKASLKALGCDDVKFTVKLCQIVNLIDKKQIVKMSKRAGNFILVKEILPKIGKDSLRVFMLSRKNDAHLDFDLEKCINENSDNPCFYIQYAYARINSLKKTAKEKNIILDDEKINSDEKYLLPVELNIIKTLSLWPKIIESSVIYKEPHKIVYYLIDLASKFHAYWSLGKSQEKYKILSDDNLDLTQMRLLLLEMIQSVIKNGLEILSISVKNKM